MCNTTKIKHAAIFATAVLLVLAAPLSVTSATATPVDEGQTTAVTENVDVWERSLLPLRTTSTGPTTIAAPQTYINVESAQTGDVPLNRDQYTIHEAGEPVGLTFESTIGAGTSAVAGDEAQLLAVKLSERPDAAGFSDGSIRTELARLFTNDSSASSVELLDDGEGVGSIDDNGALETSYTPDSGGAYGFVLVTVDDGAGLSVSDGDVSTDGNVTVVGVEQTLVQDSDSTVDATADDVGGNVTLDVETELDDDSVTHAVLVFNESELQQRTSTVRVTGDIGANLSEDQVTVENSFDGVSGVSATHGDAAFAGESTATRAMPSAGLVGLFGFVLSEASSDATGDDMMYASATTVSESPDTTVAVETLDSWPTGTYTYVHVAVGEDSDGIASSTGTVTLSQSNETDSGDDDSEDETETDDGGSDGSDDGDDNGSSDDGNDDNGGSDDGGDDNNGGSDDSDDDDSSDGGDGDDSSDGSDDGDGDDGDDESETESDDATDEDTEALDTDNGAVTDTGADDGTEAVETDGGAQTEAATTAAGGGAQQPDDVGATATPGSVETTSSSGPGFTVLVAVLALLGAGLLARRD
ncbi:PGF-CTERM sorting domain-containing protein [Haloarcula brevis]|uniref:PGF-CTERM sorting domain-containing protein n=1 Tax=Haloarcula brevis TaxID=3111453 RepID=UPI00300EC985